ncbi:MAG TPA: fructosamine kinase family protein, partial [Solirubrobacteraceae bacterium]|nr:fructosamine kinase family protein [Solirubrobacteraceae bacterium]
RAGGLRGPARADPRGPARVTLPPGAREVRRVGGGDINEAYRVTLADGTRAFVKTRADPARGEYAAEAAGLRWLAQPGALRTPRVLEAHERYLALEWIDAGEAGGARGLDDAGAEELGRGLARTHLAGAACFGGAGGADARFGSLALPNEPAADWPSFYAQRRLLPLARIARERGALDAGAVAAVERVCERLPELVGPAEAPARLHGDLWSGNVMVDAHARPWLIDPCAYGGHREVDLAMLRLFGAPCASSVGRERVFAAYEELAPLADGWRERVELFQLLPLLVHALLFGGGYAHAAARVAARYAR